MPATNASVVTWESGGVDRVARLNHGIVCVHASVAKTGLAWIDPQDRVLRRRRIDQQAKAGKDVQRPLEDDQRQQRERQGQWQRQENRHRVQPRPNCAGQDQIHMEDERTARSRSGTRWPCDSTSGERPAKSPRYSGPKFSSAAAARPPPGRCPVRCPAACTALSVTCRWRPMRPIVAGESLEANVAMLSRVTMPRRAECSGSAAMASSIHVRLLRREDALSYCSPS